LNQNEHLLRRDRKQVLVESVQKNFRMRGWRYLKAVTCPVVLRQCHLLTTQNYTNLLKIRPPPNSALSGALKLCYRGLQCCDWTGCIGYIGVSGHEPRSGLSC